MRVPANPNNKLQKIHCFLLPTSCATWATATTSGAAATRCQTFVSVASSYVKIIDFAVVFKYFTIDLPQKPKHFIIFELQNKGGAKGKGHKRGKGKGRKGKGKGKNARQEPTPLNQASWDANYTHAHDSSAYDPAAAFSSESVWLTNAETTTINQMPAQQQENLANASMH